MTDVARKFGFYTGFAESYGKRAQICRLFLVT